MTTDVLARLGDDRGESPDGWTKPTSGAPIPVTRCYYEWPEGHARHGDRCKRWSVRGTTVCKKHGGQLPGVQQHAAAMVEHYRLRLVDAGDIFVDKLIWLAENASSEAVALKASTEGLDRIGVRGGSELDVSVEQREDPAESLHARLATIRGRVVDVTPEPASDTVPELPPAPVAPTAEDDHEQVRQE